MDIKISYTAKMRSEYVLFSVANIELAINFSIRPKCGQNMFYSVYLKLVSIIELVFSIVFM